MKRSLIDALCCPATGKTGMCRGRLILCENLLKPVAGKAEGEIAQGFLRCEDCGSLYPVVAGVAVLVPDVREYLRGSFSAIAREAGPFAPQMINVLAAMTGEAAGRESQDECLDVYLRAHFGAVELNEKALNRIAGDCAGGKFYDRQADHLRRQVGRAPEKSETTALDLGCGVGGMTWRMAKLFDHVIGMDLSFPAVFLARRILCHEPCSADPGSPETYGDLYTENAEFLVASALAVPFRDGKADCVTSINLVDVLPDPQRHLHETARLLRRNGVLHLSDPFCWSQVVLDDIKERNISSEEYLRSLFRRAEIDIQAEYEEPWALSVHDRQMNLYLCRCLDGIRQR